MTTTRRSWKRWVAFAGLAVAAIACALGLTAFFFERLPTLTEDGLEAAEDRWEQSGVTSYAMDLEISGARAGNLHVEVKDGIVVKLNRDGQVPRERRTWDVWSVPGQFDMLRRGLEISADPKGEMQADRGTQVWVQARFHPQLGYPLAFRQVMLGGGPEFAWRTIRFERR